MKKITRAALLALAGALLLASCENGNGAEPPQSDVPEEYPNLSPFKGDIPKIILPAGTGVEIPAWDKESDKYKLPPFETNLKINTDKNTGAIEEGYKTNRTQVLKDAMIDAQKNGYFDGKKAKNVIYVFGDGMGESHWKASSYYYWDMMVNNIDRYYSAETKAYTHNDDGDDVLTKTAISKMNKKNTEVTDSSAGGTALTTGYKTRYGLIGLDRDGNEVKNLSELARENGMLVGNITNDHMGDATPADTYIHDTCRDHQDLIYFKEFLFCGDIEFGYDCAYNKIISANTWKESVYAADAEALAKVVAVYDKGKATGSKLADQVAAWKKSNPSATSLEEMDYKYSLLQDYMTPGNPNYVNAYGFYSAVQYWDSIKDQFMAGNNPFNETITDMNEYKKHFKCYSTFADMVKGQVEAEYKDNILSKGWDKGETGYAWSSKTTPNWAEMVAWTLSDLDHKAKANGDCGFFCMLENTCHDYYGHKGNALGIIREAQNYDEGAAVAIKFALENPDTLLIFTADHETGGLELSKGWEDSYKKATSSTTNHSAQYVPCAAFGAYAKELWPERSAGRVATNDYTGQLAGKAILMAHDKTGDDLKFGNVDGYADDPYKYVEAGTKFIK